MMFPAYLRVAGALVLTALLLTPRVEAQSLPDLNLEDLMGLDAGQVFGASERLQPVIEAPASVSFISAEEIARYGYRTLADILRSVRGLYVTDDRNFSYIGIRGFGNPGDYNSRILLLVNGHRVNDNVFGQAEIGAEFGMDPATFERVEIIRGPASSLYGDSAIFAVVNVITRTGAALNGTALTVEAGNLGTQLVRGSFGRRLASGLDVATSATFERTDGVDRLYFPEYDAPETNSGIAEGLDGQRVSSLYGRVSFRELTVTAAYGNRRRHVPTASYASIFNFQEFKEETTDRHTLLDAEYVRNVRGTRVAIRTSYDGFSYDGNYPRGLGELLFAHNEVLGRRWTVGARLTRALPGRQTLTAGAEFIDNFSQNQATDYVNLGVEAYRLDRSSTQRALFVQDEVKVTPWLILNGGLRYDNYNSFSPFSKVTPRTAVIVMPSSTQSFKYLYGRAFRAPNAYELNTALFDAEVPLQQPESIDTHELVWERYTNDWLRTAVSGYWYKAQRLLTLVAAPGGFLGQAFVNQGDVEATGLEFEAQMRLPRGFQAIGSYAVQKATNQDTDLGLPNSPRHLFKLRGSVPLKAVGSSMAVEMNSMSGRDAVWPGIRVSAVTTVNLTVIQPFGRSWLLTGSVRNLFDASYSDPVLDPVLLAVPQYGRTARLGLTWKLPGK